MKALVCMLCLMLLFCGCGRRETVKLPSGNTSSQYIDANVDFTGKVTIVGRWQCVTETQNGETRDASKDGIYYIFSSDGTVDSFYRDANMGVYSTYVATDDQVTLKNATTSITLNYSVTETTLTLSIPGGAVETVYQRVPYLK